MNTIIEYIMSNYTWILFGIIIILLAIIGSYADKTNFGQRKQDKDIDNDKTLLPNKTINDSLNTKTDNKKEKNKNKKLKNTEKKKKSNLNTPENSIKESDLEVQNKKSFDDQFDIFNEEFNEALPEKEIIDEDLLNEIDNLSLDKTQKINLDDIPDLDDVDLPKIKNLKANKDEDIWKF